MRVIDKFIAGFNFGIKANISHVFPKGAEKEVWKESTKWMKADEKAQKKMKRKK